jgi:geranylgeranyl diphosphate synthase type 3
MTEMLLKTGFCLLQYSENKSYCEDLTEGKFSFPVIHAIKSHPDDSQVMRILLQFQSCSLADTLRL